MRISEAKECIKALYLNTESVTALVSERGVGKTSAYQQCAQELGIGYIGLYAAALEGPDFMGLPDRDREKGITRYLAPQFLPTAQAVAEGLHPEKGLLVLEEINRVPSDTTSVLYPLLLEKKINGHALAPGWSIGVTMNPDTMNYLVSALDDAMLDRFISIEVSAHLGDYLDYSSSHDGNDSVLKFLTAFPDLLLVVKKSADSTALSKSPTPRGWTKVQELLNRCDIPEKLMSELVAGIVGPQAAAAFYGYLKRREDALPATEALLSDYGSVRSQVVGLVNHRRLDLLNAVVRNAAAGLGKGERELANLEALLEDLPEELQVLFFKHLAASRPEELERVAAASRIFDRVGDRIVDLMQG